ncbi:MAG: DUF924 family protein [Myxococcota bacterium]
MVLTRLTPSDVLTFWFGSPDPRAVPPPELEKRWFRGGEAFDREVIARFAELLDHPEEAAAWAIDLAGSLAAVVAFDQLPRNAFRGSARAFATDARALRIAGEVVDAGLDREAGVSQRIFLYMPFQHAEDRAQQARAMALFGALAAEAANGPVLLDFAKRHADIVERFGRFPGRNRALGRAATPEEAAWLAAGGDTFGQ